VRAGACRCLDGLWCSGVCACGGGRVWGAQLGGGTALRRSARGQWRAPLWRRPRLSVRVTRVMSVLECHTCGPGTVQEELAAARAQLAGGEEGEAEQAAEAVEA
jgi:hypothetical protein